MNTVPRHTRSRFHKLVMPALAFCAITLLGGCFGGGHARINKMTPSGLSGTDLACWVNMEFRKYPKGINLRDVKIIFSSDALVETATFDWNFIAPLAMVKKKTGGWGRINAEGIAPNLDPRLKYPFDIRFPLRAKTNVPAGGSLVLKADLYWGGKKQHSLSKSIRYLYKKQ